MVVLQGNDPDLYERIQEINLIRQYQLLTNCIEIGLQQGPMAFDKYMLWSLNHIAVANISQFGGRFREEPVYVGDHIPPHFKEIPNLIDRFVSFIHENWFLASPTQLASYALWRLNWIHPFVEGNGRTARAACYYLLNVRSSVLLHGDKIVPERIRENRDPYIAALRAADRAWDQGNLDLSPMEAFLARLLEQQLTEDAESPDSESAT
jgi:Fic family protein